MSDIRDLVDHMRKAPTNVRYADLCWVCDHYFGKARQESSSHRIYKTPWLGDPRVNIQNDIRKGKGLPSKAGIKSNR